MYSKCNNVEFMIYDNIDEVTEETFESLLNSYQTGFEIAPAIALSVLYAKNEKIYPAYVSKHNSNREKQIIFSNDSKERRMT